VKRVFIASLICVAVLATAGFIADGLPKPKGPQAQYWVEMDNAFGLIKGGDLKIAGVRAGTITDLKLNKKTLHARIGFRITENGFGDLRKDTFCESRPQSLIGEYFVDCDPGTSKQKLAKGATIPVKQTASTIGPDLVGDIMRRPQRQRLSIIVSTLGAGVGGNAEQLNEAIRRASPALRETDKVLAILAKQNRVIRDLNEHADTVVGDLAAHKNDVTDWVDKARNISRDSAERASDISAGWRKLPAFLAELQPAMKALGDTADSQGPALKTLASNANQLERFFNDLAPFSDASRPAFRALGQASKTGSETVAPATATVKQLDAFAKGAPELGRNLAIILEHLDNRSNTIEYDKRAAQQQGVKEPSGYSGLEALLQYVFDQTTSTNIYDQNGHILAVQAFHEDNCVNYRDGESLNKDPKKAEILKECQAKVGPNSPGVETPDPSANDAPPRHVTFANPVPTASRNEPRSTPPAQRDENILKQKQEEAQKQQDDHKPDLPHVDKPHTPDPPPVNVPKPSDILPGGSNTPPLPSAPSVPDAGKALPPVGGTGDNRTGQGELLDYLLGS